MNFILGLGIGVYVAIGIIYFLSTALFTAWLASKKGYSSGIWFALGLFFNFIALLALGFSPNQLGNNSNINMTGNNNLSGNDNVNWKCPKCNNSNPNSTFQCEKCGYKLI